MQTNKENYMEDIVQEVMEMSAVRRRCPLDATILVLTVDEDGTPIWLCSECGYYEFDE